jgi:predicted alpha/beta superfamily hydrolase
MACAAGPAGAPTDAGTDAGLAVGPLSPALVPGWEARMLTYALTSTTPGIASRQVTILTPPGYDEPANATRTYPLLVMHDGQNCFNEDRYFHGGWGAHTTSTSQIDAGVMAPLLLAFVDKTDSRPAEYVPGLGSGETTAEHYLDFLQNDVVPFVEQRWRVAPGPANHGLGGSSYGGLISLYGAWTRPARWGVVMAMSTAYAYDFLGLAAATPGMLPLRLYVDSGTRDYGGGDDGMAQTTALSDLLVSKGWVLGTDLQHVIGQGHTHDESFWRRRLPGAYAWLYPP